MGSAEIYNAVESLAEVKDCLVVGVEKDDGGYWMPLFVALADGVELDDELRSRIVAEIRQHASPRGARVSPGPPPPWQPIPTSGRQSRGVRRSRG